MKPTIGRKLWFWPNGTHIGVPAAAQPESIDPAQAMDATVVLVHDEPRISVNLLVLDHGGITWPIRSVTLRQDGEDKPTGMYCEWMPYQVRKEPKPESTVPVIDSAIEVEIQAKGLTAPRVTPSQIDAMMARVAYQACGFLNTTSIIVAAFLDGEFYLGCGHSACVSNDNFDPEIGFKIAKGAAEKVARDKLWELEGYALRNALSQA